MLRFLVDKLSFTSHTFMDQDAVAIRASYFCWNGGNKLQKSTIGLLRTWLAQLLEQTPELIARVVPRNKWQMTRLAGNHAIEWAELDLKDCLREYVLHVTRSKEMFLLIDGLDEIEGTDEVREDLINLLIELAAHKHVKICLSSRSWNIFRDAFESCSQMRLEDLTYNDISAFVHSHFYSNKRFQTLIQYDSIAAEALVTNLVNKASGVFLWVRLVVKQLLQGLRDEDGIRTLKKKVEEVPADLNDYFMCLIESIAPQDREEASQLFQVALYKEDEFVSLHSNCVLDFSFIEEGNSDFALNPSYNFSQLDFTDRGAMAFRLESTIRKLNSRCMGLLNCSDQQYQIFHGLRPFSDENFETINMKEFEYPPSDRTNTRVDAKVSLDDSKLFATAQLTVDFLHRSLRDFLLTSKVQTMLHQHTHGPYNARMYFRSARLVQLVALNKAEVNLNKEVGFASYVMSTLTVPGYRSTPGAAAFASTMRPVIENLARFQHPEFPIDWYICSIFRSWQCECSTFLTLAIDFGLDSYIRLNLTPESVTSKKGRPILDYILRPRFAKRGSDLCVGHRWPDLELLDVVLRFGADPNPIFRGVSIWAHFLCFIIDQFSLETPHVIHAEKAAYLAALKTMIQYGAEMLLPRDWLSYDDHVEFIFGLESEEDPDERFWRRFPNMTPVFQGTGILYAVSDLLECFCEIFEMTFDALKSSLLN